MKDQTNTPLRRSDSSTVNFGIIQDTIRDYRKSHGHPDSRITAILSPVAQGPIEVRFTSPAASGHEKRFYILTDGGTSPVSYYHENQI